MNLRIPLLPTLSLALIATALPACQQSLSYINIPADQSDVASNNPNRSNVAHLEAASLKAMRAEAQFKGIATILLPPGTRYETYQKVVALAGAGFALPEIAPPHAPVYEVRAIRARSADAQVDVVTPGEIRPLALFEVSLDWRAEIDGLGWRVTGVEARRIVPAAATHLAPKPDAKETQNKWFTDAEKAHEKQSEEVKKADQVLPEPAAEPASTPTPAPAPSKPAKVKFEA